MRVVGIDKFGGPEALKIVNSPVNEPAPGEIRIQVAAAAVNPIDLLMRSGAFASAFGNLRPPYILGYDAAGVIDKVGFGVSRLSVGDRVMTVVSPIRSLGGAYQESLVVKEESVVPIPDSATLVEACTLPMNGLTALAALRDLNIPEGGMLLVTGGAGWLASLTLGIAKARGLWVIADADPADYEAVLAAGADEVVERGPDMPQRVRRRVPKGVDAALDTALIGPSLLPAIRDCGALAIVRVEPKAETERNIVSRPITMMNMMEDTNALLQLRRLASEGRIPMKVFRTFVADNASAAHDIQAQGGIRGRIVLTF